jgi:glycosyltransferase involved in cell wall biosynthesis
MKTSIVITTYNGEKYIIEELESILKQTVAPNEVLIFDDKSTDQTYSLCLDFVKKKGLNTWRVTQNINNLGYIENFFQGFEKATGDIIFIADQDDIWRNNKIQKILYEFEHNNSMLALSSTFSRFMNGITLSPHVHHPHARTNRIKKISLHEFCEFNSYLGMSIAFHKKLLPLIHQKYRSLLSYDILISLMAVLNNGFYHLDIPLVDRRSYPDSVSNIAMLKSISNTHNKRLSYISYSLNNMIDIYEIAKLEGKKGNLLFLQKYITITEKRKKYISTNNILQWLISIKDIKYIKLYSFLYDGYSILKKTVIFS